MDPNETLRLMREALEDSSLLEGDAADRAREDVCEYVRALDEWLTKGGFLPDAWARPASSSAIRTAPELADQYGQRDYPV